LCNHGGGVRPAGRAAAISRRQERRRYGE
jgi:hypothetical protein